MARIIDLYPQNRKKTLPNASPAFSPGSFDLAAGWSIVSAMRDMLQQIMGTSSHRWLTPSQVRRKFGISPRVLHYLQEKESLPFTEIAGEIYFDPIDIETLLRARKRRRRKFKH